MAKERRRPADMAKLMGVSRQAFQSIMNFKKKPSDENLQKIADALNVPVAYFYEDNSVNQQANGNSGVIMGNNNSNVNNVAASHGGDIEEIRQELRETRESLGDKIKILEAKLDLILEKLRKGK